MHSFSVMTKAYYNIGGKDTIHCLKIMSVQYDLITKKCEVDRNAH